MPLISLYAALLALLFVNLSFRTIHVRRELKIAVGDGGNPALLRAMRVHANFAEYVPLSLLLIYWVEVSGAHPVWVHGLGATLLIGRLSHAYGISQVNEDFRFRVAGMFMTLLTLLVASGYLIISHLVRALG